MDKTNVEDMLINMIEPKLTEIESRFSQGEGLSGEDINTLLLKAQYNHINHLDLRLNEVTADVASLKTDFNGKFNLLENKFNKLENKFENKFERLEEKVDNRFTLFEEKLGGLEKSVDSRITGLEKSVDTKITGLTESMDSRMTSFEKNIELKLSEAINKNMRWSIGFIAVLMAVLKVVDILAK